MPLLGLICNILHLASLLYNWYPCVFLPLCHHIIHYWYIALQFKRNELRVHYFDSVITSVGVTHGVLQYMTKVSNK